MLTSSSSSYHHFYTSPLISSTVTCCRRQFLRKMWPNYIAFRLLISCRIFLCSLTLSNTSSFLTRSGQLIFPIRLQHHISKFASFPYLLPEASKFQYHTNLYSKCSILIVSPSVPSPFCQYSLWKNAYYYLCYPTWNMWDCVDRSFFLCPCLLRSSLLRLIFA
jgi:hypothetical protein